MNDLGEGDLMENIQISIVIPVFNVEKYLYQCIESVVNQTYRNLEIVIVDDGSTDGSGSICNEYAKKDERVRVYHTENRGLSAARNYALDRLHGEYIAFLDSDDWLEPNAIEHFLDKAQNTGADIVACRFYQEFKDRTKEQNGPNNEFTVEGEKILKSMILDHKLTEDVWNKFYKAILFNAIRFPEGRIFEDKATTYKLLQKASVLAYTPYYLIHYRNRVNSLSNIHSMKSLLDYWVVYRERVDTIGGISEQYYRVALSECIGAISRMWRWYAGCTEGEKKGSQNYLDEMHRFLEAHRNEVLSGKYSRHVKMTCWYAKFRSPLLFKLLYAMNSIYRGKNRNVYFE